MCLYTTLWNINVRKTYDNISHLDKLTTLQTNIAVSDLYDTRLC